MSINNILVVMDMESGGCENSINKLSEFLELLKGKVSVLAVLESVKKAEDMAISFGMPFDPEMKKQSIERTIDRLKHMFSGYKNVDFFVKVGDFEEEARKVVEQVNPDMLIVMCNNFNKNISKFVKSLKKPVLLIN